MLVGRPPEQEGYPYEEVIKILEEKLQKNPEEAPQDIRGERTGSAKQTEKGKDTGKEPAAAGRNLEQRIVTLIGIGMGTPSGMTVEAARAVDGADLLIGAGRMLEAAGRTDRPF